MKRHRLRLALAFSSLAFSALLFNNCSDTTSTSSPTPGSSAQGVVAVELSFSRIDQAGYDPFDVTVSLKKDGQPLSGQSNQLTRTIPNGAVGPISDLGNGLYRFRVTPSTSGLYPVTVSFQNVATRRDAIVANTLGLGVGQPLLVPGDYVNTEGYEDGVTITPDGQYLFVQYGPIYFSGLFGVGSICANPNYSLYDILNCGPKTNSNWVFDTIGPFAAPLRPGFPIGAISNSHLTHINYTLAGVANGLPLFPTVFYGFKKQSDGTFAEPFKVAFNDAKGASGPFGLSFQMTSATTAKFAVAWNNLFNDLGDDKPDIYTGNITMGQNKSLGDVVYNGELFQSIAPTITPVSFTSNTGVQGNPHLYYDSSGTIQSIWVDDEQVTHDLKVYKITSGVYPNGTWNPITLPSKINTAASESQPFFTGTRLYLTRDTRIVYHDYLGTGHSDYGLNSSWGNEVVVLEAGNLGVGTIFGFGEPTIANVDGKTLLYFAVVKSRALGAGGAVYDYDLDAGFVEVP
jgi:hypothetical protein